MTKKSKPNKVERDDHSPNTVFVSNLPYTFTNSQLEELFSDVGPIRRCFIVATKGCNQNRGFGFVQFANKEDANRAIALKSGFLIGDRKVSVKNAMHRASLDERRTKRAQGADSSDKTNTAFVSGEETSHKRELVKARKSSELLVEATDKTNCSAKQRVARTVIFGCLHDDIAEDVHRLAKELGNVCSVTFPLPEIELQQFGLAQEGCKSKASAVLYSSVREARCSVTKMHRKEVKGETVWARQLGGEGSKTHRWKVIIRNLPFKARENEIRDLFSLTGFVWDVFIPQNTETGIPKGFAFVKYTCKNDAEKAILKFNKYKFGKRIIAVDWAIPKKVYSATSNESISAEDAGQQLAGDSCTENSDSDVDDLDVHAVNEEEKSKSYAALDESDASSEKDTVPSEVNFDEEEEIARKVMNTFVNQFNVGSSKSDLIESDAATKDNQNVVGARLQNANKRDQSLSKESDNGLERTVFLSNLPFDLTVEEVKQRFSVFGEVQSFTPVLHKVTKRPRGTGFLKFKTTEAAAEAVLASNVDSGFGIFLKGRQLSVMKALDRESALNKASEKAKVESHDQRNLSLAKEGTIVEGSSASVSVSASDMAKRKALHEKKMQKLQSPNFHVSKTRLVIHNLPKHLTEDDLKQLCINAVISRAKKQKPVIRQIKFLRSIKGSDSSKLHSRGVAFVEFTEHQHALVALRVLNNNPETFGLDRRPIVEFAVDNVQTLKQRNAKMKYQQDTGDDTRSKPNDDASRGHNPYNSRKRKFANKFEPTRDNHSRPSFDGRKNEDPKVKRKGKNELRGVAGKDKSIVGRKNMGGDEGHRNRKKRKINKEPLGRDVTDQLDKLIAQYRSKFAKAS